MTVSVGPLYVRDQYDGSAGQTRTAAVRLLGYHRAPGHGVLPPGLRLIGPGGTYWVLERPAGELEGILADGGDATPFRVPCPWVVFVVEQFTIRLFARPGPLTRVDDPLYHLPLPGVAADGRARFKANGRQIDSVLAATLARFEHSTWEGPALDPPEGWPDDAPAVLARWAEVPGRAAACRLPWRERGPLAAVLARARWRPDGILATIREVARAGV